MNQSRLLGANQVAGKVSFLAIIRANPMSKYLFQFYNKDNKTRLMRLFLVLLLLFGTGFGRQKKQTLFP